LELFEVITGQRGEINRCQTVDLVVPTDASIIIEGLVSSTRMAQDGPNPGPYALFCPCSEPPVFFYFD
jgi:UbiD family decarboxylase